MNYSDFFKKDLCERLSVERFFIFNCIKKKEKRMLQILIDSKEN